VSWTQEWVGSREFVEWQVILDEREREPQRQDYLAASIVQAITRVLHKHPNRVKLKDCLVRWGKPVKPQAPDDDEDVTLTETQEDALNLKQQQSKAFWGALAGVQIA
jgi:hypothetical protein